MATFCFSPLESFDRPRPSSSSMPTAAAVSSIRRAISSGSTPAFSQGKASSLRTSKVKNSDRGSWKT